jgi:uncharacterized protein YbjT (DUF2867 family)
VLEPAIVSVLGFTNPLEAFAKAAVAVENAIIASIIAGTNFLWVLFIFYPSPFFSFLSFLERLLVLRTELGRTNIWIVDVVYVG